MDAPLYDGCRRLSLLSVRQIAPKPRKRARSKNRRLNASPIRGSEPNLRAAASVGPNTALPDHLREALAFGPQKGAELRR